MPAPTLLAIGNAIPLDNLNSFAVRSIFVIQINGGCVEGEVMLGNKVAEELQALVEEARVANDMNVKVDALGKALAAIATALKAEEDVLARSVMR